MNNNTGFYHMTFIVGILLMCIGLLSIGCKKEKTAVSESEVKVSQKPANRVALLEDFTGVRCVVCPDGHTKAAAAQDTLGKDNFIILAVHGGGYATPKSGWANFTTPYSSDLIYQAKVAGYPAGTINRIKGDELGGISQMEGGMALGRGSWQAAAKVVLSMPTPVNIGAIAKFNPSSRELSVMVDLFYTNNETAINNINVAFVQDKLMSKQIGAKTDPYQQNHVLIDLITGQWGDLVEGVKTKETKVTRTYTYTVPADYHGTTEEGGGAVVIENCSVVVFVSRGNADILTAIQVPIDIKP